MQWILDNLGTIITAAVVLAAVCGIIVYMVKRKKQGKCIGCDGCGCKSTCGNHKSTDKDKKDFKA